MRDLRKLNLTNIEYGKWSGQLPHLNKSYLVQDRTAENLIKLDRKGTKIVVGNSPYGPGEMISQVNSRYHGYSIRTIRAL